MDEMVVRLAQLKDHDEVMEASEGVYEGLDYLPAIYYILLQSPEYIVYVAEFNNKVIYLLAYHKHSDEPEVMHGMTARIHPQYTGRNLGKFAARMALTDMLKNNVRVRRTLGDEFVSKYWTEIVPKERILYKWNVLTYKISSGVLKTNMQAVVQVDLTTVMLNYSDAVHILQQGDQLEQFLKPFLPSEYLPSLYTWQAITITKKNLRELFAMSQCCITLSKVEKSDPSASSCQLNTPIEGDTPLTIKALSYATTLRVPYGARFDVFFYGSDVTTLMSHVHAQLRHLLNVCVTYVGLQLHFPSSFEAQSIHELLRPLLGERLAAKNYGKSTKAMMHFNDLNELRSNL